MRAVVLLLLVSLALCGANWSNAGQREQESPSLRAINALASEQGSPRFSEHWLDVGPGKLHYVTAGTGPLVVFHHGFPSHWYMWKRQLLDLSRDHRVIALDGLGFNLSDKPEDPSHYRVEALAGQLSAFLHAVSGSEAFDLVGHDWGGALAWAMAQAGVEGLRKVVVLSAPPYNQFLSLLESNRAQRETSAYMWRLKTLALAGEESPAVADQLCNAGYAGLVERALISTEELALFCSAIARPGALSGSSKWYGANVPDPGEAMGQYAWPGEEATTGVSSMLIWGEEDRAFVPEFVEALHRYAPGVRIEQLPGTGHWPSLEAPEIVNALLRDFLTPGSASVPSAYR